MSTISRSIKTFSFFIFILVFLWGCNSDSSSYKVTGTVDLEDGKSIYVIEVNQYNQPSIIDTVLVSSGKFEFSGTATNPDISFLEVEGIRGNVPFVVEAGSIQIRLHKDSILSSKVMGTISNEDLASYRIETRGFSKALGEIAKDMQQASLLNDNILYEDLQQQYKDVQQQIQEYEMSFVSSEYDSYISALILEKILAGKVISNDSILSLYNNFTPRIKESRSGKIISEALNKPTAPTIGKAAPMFEAPSPEGNMISLKNQLGKITIVDFWASWCRPCRVENPNLVKMYNRLNPKGLEIVGVSLDKEASKWLQAIEDDGLQWQHVSHLKFWQDPIAALYQVSAIPTSFVLDSEGIIVAKNLRGQQLEDTVSELLEAQ